MPSITGIELASDSCVLVSARALGDAAEVSALHLIERAEWPQHDLAQATMLRAIRRRKRLPRRAHVVAWGLTEPAPAADPHVRSFLKPIIAAGFRVEKVMTPAEALAAVSRTRPRAPGAAVAWLALNVHGVAIAIVRDGALLFARTFEWNHTGGVLGTRAELLQRYSLVSHLAPEVRRGIMTVRSSHAAIVETIITCGDLPDLRSLTMPLIEELDLEVETLDSTEGLLSAATARNDRFAESAPALRLAVAAATSAAVARGRGRRTLPPILKPAAVALLVGFVGWVGQRYWKTTEVRPVGERVAAATAPAPPRTAPPSSMTSPLIAPPPASASAATPQPFFPSTAATASAESVQPPPSVTPQPKPLPPSVALTPQPKPLPPPAVLTPEPKAAPTAAVAAPQSKPAPPAATTFQPRPTPPPVTDTASKPTPPPPVLEPVPQKPAAAALKPAPVTRPPVTEVARTPAPVTPPPATEVAKTLPPKPAVPEQPKPVSSERTPQPLPAETPRDAEKTPAEPPRAANAARPRPPVPLKEAVPSLDSILIAKDRRVAIVGGAIVAVGDAVGSRVVSQIERDSVVLKEPSGYEIRVRLRQGPGTE